MQTDSQNKSRPAGYSISSNVVVDNETSTKSLDSIIEVIKAHQNLLLSELGVLNVRPGFSIQSEQIRASSILVITDPASSPAALPPSLDGIPVEVRSASAQELVEGFLSLSVWEGLLAEAVPRINYTPPSDVALLEQQVHIITCHVGPDSGWNTLKPFLEGTTRSLTVAMYEFYADHIVEAITALGEQTLATLSMILQVDKNDKTTPALLQESWGDRLDFAEAWVSGPTRLFNNSYHTKVAVRDSSAFWLSSGNWSPNSQPQIGPGTEQVLYSKGNREWHLIIENKPLAEMYEKFIRHDMEQARQAASASPAVPESTPVLPDLLIPESLFQPESTVIQDHPFVARTLALTGPPVRVKPLMSPDNYAAEILKLIRAAENSLFLQFSYIRQPSTETFNEIISAIAEKMRDGLDVRVLVGSSQKPEHSQVLMTRRGWKPAMFRRQTSKIHNKGILIDGKITVVGSNNWSSDGTQYNRDTSLVLFSEEIARYFTEVFLFDWSNLSTAINNPQPVVPVLAPETGPTPPGMVRIPWQAWFNE